MSAFQCPIIGLTLLASREPAPEKIPFAEAPSDPEHAVAILDRWKPWLTLARVLIAIAYGPTLLRLVATTRFTAPLRAC